ncbi:hypothetical protein AMAG_10022 [Allomyces macrogynus ATCC 38327]|uniref:Uncharacterized protein n=1 Tax=Allomyces macrogynus (strain ATCC 38327) TaxID=578462 RepID=A0A0L0SQ37_ALLM3|nr:hypothetical protein AMAG_10022 [Allomyces macrogynus ATCC 38327]|eukprot:KNE64668.1 hypothetical protein AMAG_10022 [Allomyces macrogynus ATCC 38327]
MPPLTAPMLARAPPHLMPPPPPVPLAHARPVTSSWPPPPPSSAAQPETPQGPTVQQLNWALQLAIGARLVPGSAPSSLPLVITALDPARRHFVARMQVGPAHLTPHGTLHPAAVAATIDVVAAVLPLLAPSPPSSAPSPSSVPVASAPPVRSILWPSARTDASPLPFAAVPVVPHLTVLEAHAMLMAPTLGTAMASIDVMVIPQTSPGAPATAWPVLVASSRLPGAALPPPPVVPASVAALGAGLAPHHRPKI